MMRTHVVVGAGASGLCLTRKLLEDSNVILIDRGAVRIADTGSTSSDEEEESSPAEQPSALHRALNIFPDSVLWSFQAFVHGPAERRETAVQGALGGRRINYVQGSGAGGSGAVNAMIHSLGSSLVYDQLWPQAWSFERIRGALEQVHRYYRPSCVQTSGRMERAMLCAHRDSDDPQPHCGGLDGRGREMPGLATSYYAAIDAHSCRRIDLASLCLGDTGGGRGQLLVLQHCRVQHVSFHPDGSARSVRTLRRGLMEEVCPKHGGEVVLCAGVLESPRILMSSGLKRSCGVRYRSPRNRSSGSKKNTSSSSSNSSNSSNSSSSSSSNRTDNVSSSHGNGAWEPPDLTQIGEQLQDHVILPYMLLGNWQQGWKHMHHMHQQRRSPCRDPDADPDADPDPGPGPGPPSASDGSYLGKPLFPLNSVHGWANLTAQGELWREGDDSPPCAQLLFVDGRISAGLTDLLLPRFQNAPYRLAIRPCIAALLQLLGGLSLVQWLLGHFFGVLVCVTQPRSRGRLSRDSGESGEISSEDNSGDNGESSGDGERSKEVGGDLSAPLTIDPGYLTDAHDLQVLHRAFNAARRIMARARESEGLWALEVLPGPLFGSCESPASFRGFWSVFANSYFHGCGSCAMQSQASTQGQAQGPTGAEGDGDRGGGCGGSSEG
eukprot:CAMPEP_0173365672 /NCGR_PEP_ID=MMETSP1144-20121109/23767_1 /TAXON_ID=483371 /ORGANISM="non described non described, Strain CCMP2298" /LENGTH=663 /DNA_ID=CAMNT_0014316151 /DNA_START=234 /DNA_END=2222 /DNA_ORIENTATION=+